MQIVKSVTDPVVVQALKAGQLVVLRTDTLYGILAMADDQAAVGRVYQVKQRNHTKPPIILVASRQQLYDQPGPELESILDTVWPGRVSVIMPSDVAPDWVRRGGDSVAYRMPADEQLRRLLAQTGRLIAPSANPEGQTPAMTISEATQYFGDKIDVYVDGGTVTDDTPSQLLRLNQQHQPERLR